jgi:hypothetical protein
MDIFPFVSTTLDNEAYYVLMGCGIFFTCVRLINTASVNEKLLAIVSIGLAIAYIYKRQSQETKSTRAQTEVVQSVLGILDTSSNVNKYLTTPVKMLLEKDHALLGALEILTRLSGYNNGLVVEIISGIVEFYQKYAKLLLRNRASKHDFIVLTDKRFEVLRNLHALFVSVPNIKHAKVLEIITLQVQSATYKSLNVLKNKYNFTDVILKPPHASNAHHSEYEVF